MHKQHAATPIVDSRVSAMLVMKGMVWNAKTSMNALQANITAMHKQHAATPMADSHVSAMLVIKEMAQDVQTSMNAQIIILMAKTAMNLRIVSTP